MFPTSAWLVFTVFVNSVTVESSTAVCILLWCPKLTAATRFCQFSRNQNYWQLQCRAQPPVWLAVTYMEDRPWFCWYMSLAGQWMCVWTWATNSACMMSFWHVSVWTALILSDWQHTAYQCIKTASWFCWLIVLLFWMHAYSCWAFSDTSLVVWKSPVKHFLQFVPQHCWFWQLTWNICYRLLNTDVKPNTHYPFKGQSKRPI